MTEQELGAMGAALSSIACAIEDLSEHVEALVAIMTRLTFVDYGGHEDNQKPLNLRIYINRRFDHTQT